jgi:hypothetical protein
MGVTIHRVSLIVKYGKSCPPYYFPMMRRFGAAVGHLANARTVMFNAVLLSIFELNVGIPDHRSPFLNFRL